jgi:ATP-dependent Zn protease
MESYEKERQIPTEHPVIEDDGDGTGTDEPGKGGTDGALARTVFLAPDPGARAAAATTDPVLRALYEERRGIEARIAELKASKDRLGDAEFDRRMEQLLVELAKKDREIREKEKKQP